MSAISNADSGHSLTHRPTVARRQLHASLGALVVMGLIVAATAISLRGSAPSGQVALNTPSHAPIVKTTVRETPSKRMQADQGKSARGI